jgi:hypothetical protein
LRYTFHGVAVAVGVTVRDAVGVAVRVTVGVLDPPHAARLTSST